MSSALAVNQATFDTEVLKANEPVLVDFWADWCGPCKMIAPIVDKIAKDYADRLQIAKINVDEHQSTPVKFGVRGREVMLFSQPRPVATIVEPSDGWGASIATRVQSEFAPRFTDLKTDLESFNTDPIV